MHRHRPFPTACVAAAIAATALLSATSIAAPPAPWRHVRTVRPERALPGAHGPAIACAGGDLWIGPARDRDAGVGPPCVSWRRVRAGFGLPDGGAMALRHPEGHWNAGFGLSLAAARGTCVVGSPHAGCRAGGCDSGQAHLFRHDRDGSWIAEEIACPVAEPASEFGAAAATDGRTIVIGSPRADGSACDAGAVDVYEIASEDGSPRFVVRLVPPQPVASGHFGASVAVDGDWLAVGEPGTGGSFPKAGMVHVARRIDGTWRIHESLRAPAGAVGWHGASVALAGCDLLAGAPVARTGSGREATGAVAWWRLEGQGWTLRTVLMPPEGANGDGFGMSVDVADGWIAVGSPGRDLGSEDTGCAWTFGRGGAWRIDPPDPRAGRGFGSCVRFGDADGLPRAGPDRFLAVASMQDPELPPEPGTVELFGLLPAQPASVAHPAGPQSRSASAMAIAAEASVTTAGRQPDSRILASAASP